MQQRTSTHLTRTAVAGPAVLVIPSSSIRMPQAQRAH